MIDALVPIRILNGDEPVIIAPPGSTLWPSCRRLKGCEIYALADSGCERLMSPLAWLDLAGRDVCFWPLCIWSAHVMTLIVHSLISPEPPNGPMIVIRWAWGHPAADELGEPEARIETIWRRTVSPQRLKAAA